MLLTAEQYETVTGEAAPSDFTEIDAMVEGEFNLMTLNYYNLADTTDLPDFITDALTRYLAYKVQECNQSGGIAGANEANSQSESLGRWSHSGGKAQSTAADKLLPILLSATKGILTCDQYPYLG